MNPVDRLTPEQKHRAAQLLEVIVRPGDHQFGKEIEEAQELFGYVEPRNSRKNQHCYYAKKRKTT